MKKRICALICLAVLSLGMFAFTGCKNDKTASGNPKFTIAMFSGGRGSDYMQALIDEFKKTYVGEIELVASSSIEDDIPRLINDGNYPDLIFLGTGKPKSVTEGLIKDRKLEDLTSLLDEPVAGEDTKLRDKLVDNILTSAATNPYGGERTYLLPLFYSPTGLFYDANKFGSGKPAPYDRVPATWEEFFAMGDALYTARQADAAVPYLFTYPTAGYFDSIIYPTIASIAGMEKYQKAISYADGIWEDADVKAALSRIAQIGTKDAAGKYKYLEPNTPAQANQEGFIKNQQAVIGSGTAYDPASATALFIPNGDWFPAEMSETTPEGFAWGFAPIPKKGVDSAQYINTFVEQVYIHNMADNKQAAKNFIKLMFSDRGADIVAKTAKAIIPTKYALGAASQNGVPQETIALYDLYRTVNPVIGAFAATEPVPDVVWQDIFLAKSVDEVMKGTMTVDSWSSALEAASDKLRAKLITM